MNKENKLNIFAIVLAISIIGTSYGITENFNTALAGHGGPHHDITIEAVKMPDDLYAYKIVEHTIDGDDVTEKRYGSNPDPSIPGPAIVLNEGDVADVTLVNNVSCDDFPDSISGGVTGESRETPEISKIGIHVHGVHYTITDDGTTSRNNKDGTSAAACGGGEVTYQWRAKAGTHGAWPYHDHTFTSELGGEDVGLFGTVIVNPADGKVKSNQGGDTKIVEVDDLEKDYVLWMTSTETLGRSLFYGLEIDYSKDVGQQTPLWVNPTLVANEGDNVRFNVFGMGDEIHSFHLHGHRWIQSQGDAASGNSQGNGNGNGQGEGNDITDNVIDVQEIAPLQRKSFVIQAGEGVGIGDWMYHCHVFEHMQEGMRGVFRVLPEEKDASLPKIGATFMISDEPGLWFKTMDRGDLLETVDPRKGTGYPLDFLAKPGTSFDNTEGRSLAVIQPGESVLFSMKDSQTVHTITSLIWPADAEEMSSPFFFDKELSLRGSTYLTDDSTASVIDPDEGQKQVKLNVPVTFEEPGLYVFTCKIHPYMFAAVIVDDDGQLPLNIGEEVKIATRTGSLNNPSFPTQVGSLSSLNTGLVKTFYVVTDPNNWKDYTKSSWEVSLPNVPVTDGNAVVNLQEALGSSVEISADEPEDSGIGQVWIDTQFERTLNKNPSGTSLDKPGTMTAVNTDDWSIDRKVALPEINMNHPHNMWADVKLENIYQTQWFDNRLTTVDRDTGELVKDIRVGESPSHVMTVPDGSDEITVAMNGEEQVTTVDPLKLEINKQFTTGVKSHPHGHWVGTYTNGSNYVVTPNFFTSQASIVNLEAGHTVNANTGVAPIATGLIPDSNEFYTADFLGNSFTKIDAETGNVITQIDLLANGTGLPIQTPVSPDGKFMVTGNVLGSKITVLNTDTDKVVAVLACEPGCHGVNWGAKESPSGDEYPYYAYVASKFSNAMVVVDPVPTGGNSDGSNAVVAGKVVLTEEFDTKTDDRLIDHFGMGGQGVLPVPNVYDGFIQETIDVCGTTSANPCSQQVVDWLSSLTSGQQDP